MQFYSGPLMHFLSGLDSNFNTMFFGALSVIDTTTNMVTATIPVGRGPFAVAVSPDGSKVYVTNEDSNSVSVVDTATNTVTATIPITVGIVPDGVAVSPDGSKVYVTNSGEGTGTGTGLSVIDTETNRVTATIPVGNFPFGVAVTSDGRRVYVANSQSNTVSVIDTETNRVTATIPVGSIPTAFGIFIQPVPIFAGTPGKANCHGNSVSALARQFGGLNGAAAALGYSSLEALQEAILTLCEG